MSWREKAIETARAFFDRDIVDGTPEGNRVIGMEIIGGATGRPDPDYKNGKTAYCGYFVMACYRAAGFNRTITLASPGKVRTPYGRYHHASLPGTPRLARSAGGPWVPLAGLHLRQGSMRLVMRPDDPRVEAGDILIYCKGGGWRGHVMLIERVNPNQIHIIDGNGLSFGPRHKRRDGVGIRAFSREHKELLNGPKDQVWVVKPSDMDFDPEWEYRA